MIFFFLLLCCVLPLLQKDFNHRSGAFLAAEESAPPGSHVQLA